MTVSGYIFSVIFIALIFRQIHDRRLATSVRPGPDGAPVARAGAAAAILAEVMRRYGVLALRALTIDR